jgi:hypothetical protein
LNAITKVLVVLLAVFCIAFSMTAISLTAQQDDWKKLATEYRLEAQISNTHQRNLIASHAAELASARDSIKNATDRINALEAKLQDATEENALQRSEIAQIKAAAHSSEALSHRLTNELSIAQAARGNIEKQRQQLESRNIELERRNVDLNERVNELTTRVTVLVQKQRQQAQQINIIREENQKLARQTGISPVPGFDSGLTGASHISPKDPPAVPRIAGHVVSIEGDYVTVSVGSSDQVQRGAVFVIFRGTQYIGDIEISDVQPNLSAGKLTSVARGVTPKKGDRVEDEFHFATPQ